jgi:hypothetical protein
MTFPLASLLLIPFLSPLLTAAEPVTALATHPRSPLLAAAHSRSIQLLHPDSPDSPRHLPIDLTRITALAFHPVDSNLWISGGTPGESGVVIELATADGSELRRWTRTGDLVQTLALHPAGHAVAHADGNQLRLLPLDPPTAPVTFTGHSDRILGAAFAPDASLLVSVAADRAVKVWANASLLRTFGQHTEAPHTIAFQPGATIPTCATAGDDRTVRIWQPGIGRMVRIIRGHRGSILTLAYSPDGQSLFTAGSEGIVRRIDATSDQILGSWTASSDWIHCMAVDPDSRWIATGDATGIVTLWKPDGTLLRRWPRP